MSSKILGTLVFVVYLRVRTGFEIRHRETGCGFESHVLHFSYSPEFAGNPGDFMNFMEARRNGLNSLEYTTLP
jgi:hypothetical protein